MRPCAFSKHLFPPPSLEAEILGTESTEAAVSNREPVIPREVLHGDSMEEIRKETELKEKLQ